MANKLDNNGAQRRLSFPDRMRRLSSSKMESSETSEETKRKLAEMGYDQELRRSLSVISILSLSFAIIAVPFVCLTKSRG